MPAAAGTAPRSSVTARSIQNTGAVLFATSQFSVHGGCAGRATFLRVWYGCLCRCRMRASIVGSRSACSARNERSHLFRVVQVAGKQYWRGNKGFWAADYLYQEKCYQRVLSSGLGHQIPIWPILEAGIGATERGNAGREKRGGLELKKRERI